MVAGAVAHRVPELQPPVEPVCGLPFQLAPDAVIVGVVHFRVIPIHVFEVVTQAYLCTPGQTVVAVELDLMLPIAIGVVGEDEVAIFTDRPSFVVGQRVRHHGSVGGLRRSVVAVVESVGAVETPFRKGRRGELEQHVIEAHVAVQGAPGEGLRGDARIHRVGEEAFVLRGHSGRCDAH